MGHLAKLTDHNNYYNDYTDVLTLTYLHYVGPTSELDLLTSLALSASAILAYMYRPS